MAVALKKQIEKAHRLSQRPATTTKLIECILLHKVRHVTVLKEKIMAFLGMEFAAFQFETNLWKYCAIPFPKSPDNLKIHDAAVLRADLLSTMVTDFIREHKLSNSLTEKQRSCINSFNYWQHVPTSCGTVCHRSTCKSVATAPCMCPPHEALDTANLRKHWKVLKQRRRYRMRGPYA